MSDRKQALIAAAFDTIATKGFEGLRLRDVATRAGIDHSTLHHHFATKQALIADVVLWATSQFWPTMPPDGPARQRLRTHLDALAEMIQQRPELFVVLDEFDTRARRDPDVQAVVTRLEAGWRRALGQLFTDGGHDDPQTATELVIATVKGVRLAPQHAGAVLGQLATLIWTQR